MIQDYFLYYKILKRACNTEAVVARFSSMSIQELLDSLSKFS